MIGEVLKQLDEDRFIVKTSNGPRWVVGVRPKVSGSWLFFSMLMARFRAD